MKQAAVDRTGLSPWEADVLVKVISEVYFDDIQQVINPGQVLYSCVSATEGAGKPLKECAMKMVLLTLFDESDQQGLEAAGKKHRQTIIRQRRLMRLCEQARDLLLGIGYWAAGEARVR